MFNKLTHIAIPIIVLGFLFMISGMMFYAVINIGSDYPQRNAAMPQVDLSQYFLPIYKDCPDCKGRGGQPISKNSIWSHDCDRCINTGKVRMFISLDSIITKNDSHDADDLPVINTDALAWAIMRTEEE